MQARYGMDTPSQATQSCSKGLSAVWYLMAYNAISDRTTAFIIELSTVQPQDHKYLNMNALGNGSKGGLDSIQLCDPCSLPMS